MLHYYGWYSGLAGEYVCVHLQGVSFGCSVEVKLMKAPWGSKGLMVEGQGFTQSHLRAVYHINSWFVFKKLEET